MATKETDMDIDWHDFVIVEQIDLYEDQEMESMMEDLGPTRQRSESLDNVVQEQLKKQIQENQDVGEALRDGREVQEMEDHES